jgi:hypothetical protein
VLTKRKDLRTGRAVWEQGRAPSVPHKPLKRDLETDVLVAAPSDVRSWMKSGKHMLTVISSHFDPTRT